jgi:hypothetical protein
LFSHATNADDVGNRLMRRMFDVFINNADVPAFRTKSRQRSQPERRIKRMRFFQNIINRPLKAPEAVRKLRIYE